MNINLKDEKQTLEYLKSLTLLCVEDSEIVRSSYEAIFTDLFSEVIFGVDGEDGYEQYLNNKVDVIITDYDMPNLNGLEMVEKIRESDNDTPIILITAIDNKDIVINALQLHVNNFIQKPIEFDKIIKVLLNSAKLLIANQYLKDQRDKKLNELQEKDDYNTYQEDLAFAKELNILRNDFYYQLIDSKYTSLIDFLYHPLDVISGDAYSARRIDENRSFYLIVDGMGKGLSASLTAMLMTSFINHMIDKMIEYNSFSFDILIKESLAYIRPILLEEEALAVDYIVLDSAYNKMQYAKFAMPVILLQDTNHDIIRVKSNNPPMSRYQKNYQISEIDISKIEKFLFYSDGLVENMCGSEETTYADYIEEDFKSSFTREDLKTYIFEKVKVPEDDITLIFINRIALQDNTIANKSFDTLMSDLDLANEWYTELWEGFTDDNKVINNANVAFTELFMNAYEHGNLGIDSITKHNLLEDDTYFDTLEEMQTHCSKKIHVKVDKITYDSFIYIVTQISDEGDGFDTQILSKIFRNTALFNGRGVFVSRSSSLGIYYNSKGNTVLYLNKIENS